tara:strand:+ start:321 stop:611 length:291 start_codon:yes stop_codon:yes gene_type:complete
MTKITNIDKTPNDYVREEQEDRISGHPDHQDYEFLNPITSEIETMPRFLVRSRLAQWTHYINDEIKRLNIVHSRCLEISEHIDNQVEKEKEANKDG